jgi:hypothetical protein
MSKKEGLIEKRTYDLIFDDDLDWDETHERVGTDMALLKEYWKMVMPIIDEAKKDLYTLISDDVKNGLVMGDMGVIRIEDLLTKLNKWFGTP